MIEDLEANKFWQSYRRDLLDDSQADPLPIRSLINTGIDHKLVLELSDDDLTLNWRERVELRLRDTDSSFPDQCKFQSFPEKIHIAASAFVQAFSLPRSWVDILIEAKIEIDQANPKEIKIESQYGRPATHRVTANFRGYESTAGSTKYALPYACFCVSFNVWGKWLDAEISKSQRSQSHLIKNRSFILHEGQEISQLLSEAISGADVPNSVRDARDRLDTLLSTLRGANDTTEDLTLDIRVQAHGLKRVFDPDAFRRSFSETLGKSSANAIVWGLTMLLLYLLGDAAIDAATDTPSRSTDNIHKA